MGTYRFYILDPEGHSNKPPQLVECDDDDAAVGLAIQYVDGMVVEVWEGAKRVARLEPDTD